MQISPRTLMGLFWLVAYFMLLTSIPINEYTLPQVILLTLLFVVGLVIIFAWHYIIPFIIKTWRIGECTVERSKYVICKRRGSTEYTGYVFLKVIPEQPIAVMQEERRKSFLQSIQGVLSGIQFEAGVLFMAMRDVYKQKITERLRREREKLRALAGIGGGRTPFSIEDAIKRIDQELNILEQVPAILEGFYIAIVRDYSPYKEDLIKKLEADARGLASRLTGLGMIAEELKGEELNRILDFLLFGHVAQQAW